MLWNDLKKVLRRGPANQARLHGNKKPKANVPGAATPGLYSGVLFLR
jgi:hypothetical protein